jgi:thymidylate kinase
VAAEPTTKIVSFSGIDGAGKSTQIHALESWLVGTGLRISTLGLWNDVVVATRLRETASRRVFGGERGVGTPANPVHRRDKNVASWALTLVRCCLYFADSLSLYFRVRRLLKSGDYDVVIFDRYIYDELANLPLERKPARRLIHLLLKIVPTPDVAFLVDAEPEVARARKPEYPLEFLRRNRQAYLDLREIVGAIIVIQSGSVEDMERTIRIKLRSSFSQATQDSLLVPMRR